MKLLPALAISAILLAPAPQVIAEDPHPDAVAGGDHWRIEASSGPVHVWRPAGYQPATAGIVIYVHGYETTRSRSPCPPRTW